MHLCRRVAIHKLLCPCRKVTSSNLNNIFKIWQLWTSARGQWEHQPSIPEHPVTQCLLRLARNHPPTTVAWDAFRQLTLKGQETPCWLCFPTSHFTAPPSSFFVWRKPNNGANVSFFSSLSGEQALPLCMPLLFSQWYCAPQQHWLGKNLFHYTHNLCCGCYGGNRSIMCCQTT